MGPFVRLWHTNLRVLVHIRILLAQEISQLQLILGHYTLNGNKI